MPRIQVTQIWVVEPPEDCDDPFDYARDYILSVRPDTEDIEKIHDDD